MGSSDFNDMECLNNKYVQQVSTMSWLPCTFYPTTQGLFPARTRHHNYHNPSESEKVLRQLELHFFFFFCRNFQRNYFRLLPASQDFRNIDNTAFERPFRFMRHSCRAPASEPGSIMCFIFKFSQTFILRLNSLEERTLLETVFSLEATGRRMACKCKCLSRDLKDPPERQLLSQSIPILHLLLFLVLEFFRC